jgi:phosphoenolpyruvate synthase/pyruvate phosphate dikinase
VRLSRGWKAVPLAEARDTAIFGSKAVGLGQAARAGLPLPPGLALSGSLVEAVASDERRAVEKAARAAERLRAPLAVRSSAVDEDSAQASFAGQHLTLLNVASAGDLPQALRDVWWSANDDSVIGYRRHVRLVGRPSVGVVVQSLLDPAVAGVLFTCNPITGADERLIEASWGLGEAVVAGSVIPDRFRIRRAGEVVERTPGLKKAAIRASPNGGTIEQDVPPELVEALCLDDDQLEQLNRLAARCEELYGPARDLEWAFADGTLYLLQCRAITRAAS